MMIVLAPMLYCKYKSKKMIQDFMEKLALSILLEVSEQQM